MQPQFETYPYESQLPLPPLFLQKNNSISSYVHIPLGLSKFAAVSSSLSSVLLFSAFEGEGKGSIEIFGPLRFLGADAEAAFLLAPPEGIFGDRRTPGREPSTSHLSLAPPHGLERRGSLIINSPRPGASLLYRTHRIGDRNYRD